MNRMNGPTEFGFLRGVASPKMEEHHHIITYPYEVKCELGLRIHYDTTVLPDDFQEWVDGNIKSDYDFAVMHYGPRDVAGRTLVILWLSNTDDAMLAKLTWHE